MSFKKPFLTDTTAESLSRTPSTYPTFLVPQPSSRNPLPQRRRQSLIRLRPHLNIFVLLHQQITHQPPKNHTPPLVQMRPVIRQVIVLPAGFWPDGIYVVCAGAVEIDPACSEGFGDGDCCVAFVGQVLNDTWGCSGEGAAGEGGYQDGRAFRREDFLREDAQVGGEGGEGDVFVGFLVVVAELRRKVSVR